jgi:hypothetical protein
LGTLGVFPIAGAGEDFAVFPALFAMKLVDRHERKITPRSKSSSVKPRSLEGGTPGTFGKIPPFRSSKVPHLPFPAIEDIFLKPLAGIAKNQGWPRQPSGKNL